MVLEDRVGMAPAERVALERALAPVATLHDLIEWGLARGWMITDVVIQDEFTHDVVMPAGDGRVLVFDST